MENPFWVLGINDKGIDIEKAVAELKGKLAELNTLDIFYQEEFRKKYSAFRSNNSYAIRKSKNVNIRDFYNERYILGLSLDKKYFSKKEFFDMIKQAKELEQQARELEQQARALEQQAQKSDNQKAKELKQQAQELKGQAQVCKNKSKIYNQSIKEQSSSIRDERTRMTKLLELYQSNPDDPNIRTRIEDEYVSLKFENVFMNLVDNLRLDTSKTESFIEILQSYSGYRRILDAYNRIATAEAREDLVSEVYVKKRIDNPVSAISEENVRRITGKDKQYYHQYIEDLFKSNSQREREKATENQNHQYGWGIILTNPFYLLKDEPIDTPIFKGKITVENIGRFTEESFFRKVRMKNESRNKRRNNTKIKGIKNTLLGKLKNFLTMKAKDMVDSNEAQQPKYIRDYYYSYRASKTLYDEIYRVTKTDTEGKTRTQIVFSPITEKSIGRDVSIDFLKNVYFSDDMLDLARQNGGYAGEVFPAKNGRYKVYNDHPNCEEQIGAAILFDRGFRGSIVDRRNDRNDEYLKSYKGDFLKLVSGKERTRILDE